MVSLWIDKSHGTALTELADGRVGSSTITQSVAVMEAEAGVNGACLATFVMSTPTLCYRATRITALLTAILLANFRRTIAF